MKYTTKTEYGLNCLVYMAHKTGRNEPTTIKEMAGAEQYSQSYIEKILQTLRNADIVTAQHGNQGGYMLSRPANQITLKSVIEALEGQTFEVFCDPLRKEAVSCGHTTSMCEVSPIWYKTKELLDKFFGAITLEQIVNHEIEFQELISTRAAS